jgi:hypothetical protein
MLIDKLLKESMSDKTKLVRADIFIKDKSMFKDMNEAWMDWVHPKHPPPCTAAVMADFLDDKILVEIAVIAVVSMDYDDAPGVMTELGMQPESKSKEGRDDQPDEQGEDEDEEDEMEDVEEEGTGKQKATKGKGRKKSS